MKQDWTENMRRKLEGYEQTPPEGLWEGISEQMGLELEPVRRRSAFLGRWWWAVAAAIVVAVGIGLYEGKKETPLPAPPRGRASIATEKNLIAEETPLPAPPRGRASIATEKNLITEETPLPAPPRGRASIATEKNLITDNTLPLEEETEGAVESKGGMEMVRATRSSRSLSLSLEASGGLLEAQALHRQQRLYFANVGGYYGAPGSADGEARLTPNTLTEQVAKHYLPVRFGVGLQYPLTKRVALITGLRYTYLHSRFSIPLYENMVSDQQLHYLGLPLGVRYQLWGNRHFQFYASASAALDKCLNERPWQWSAFASAGAEYLPIRQLGIYAEPSVGYYFKDGTSLQHYYKQHPWAPSVEFGLRLHLGDR